MSGGRAQDVLQAVPEALRSRLLLDNPMTLPTEDGGLVVLAPFIGATSVTTALAFSPAGGLVGYRVVPQAYVPQGLARVRGRWALAMMASRRDRSGDAPGHRDHRAPRGDHGAHSGVRRGGGARRPRR